MDEALRARLETLNRGALPAVEITKTGRAKPQAAGLRQAAGERPWRGGAVRPVPGLLRRGEATTNGAGEHLRICLAVDELWPGGERLVNLRRDAALAGAAPATEAAGWIAHFPERLLFLDLETCGLAGSALFLAGLLRPIAGRLAVELLLARDYSEESAVIASLWERLAMAETIVTFNGKSFDWPMVVDRSRRHLLAAGRQATAPQHVDLLHLARRRWRKELPDCKLQTLERRVCGRVRSDDVPGNQIPAAYQQYVRTGFEREMDAILFHNAIDLVTMLDLSMRLATSE